MKQKKSTADVLVALLTFLNLLLTVALHLINRREILHAVQDDEETKVLLSTTSEVKAEKAENS